MGIVWLAKDLRLGEEAALKFLPREIGADPVALDDMRRETLKSRKLSHPNIIRIHDLFEAPDEAPFISMEYIDGPNLSALRLQQPNRLFTWDYLKPLVQQLCEALDYAHNEHVIHRDLKPANMMLDSKGRLKLADFGIAATLSESGSRVSVKHQTSGTMTYMSPQQMDGEVPKVTDDIYALGATLYELLTSKPPFYTGDILHQVRNLPAKPIAERLWELSLTNAIPADVASLIMACLAKDPAQRPQSARMVAQWIGLTWGDSAPQVSFAEGSESVESVTDAHISANRRVNRLRLGIATGVILFVLALGWFWHQRSTSGVAVLKDVDTLGLSSPTTVKNPEAVTPPALAVSAEPNGVLDEKFAAALNVNGFIEQAVVQSDGKVVIGGYFDSVNGVARNRVARLNPDGTLDSTFDPGTGANDRNVYGVTLQPDQKVILVGRFTMFNGRKQDHIVRLNSDGSVDTGFITQVPLNNVVRAVVQPDGKILIGGDFVQVNSTKRSHLARLNTDGSVDLSFDAGERAGQPVRSLLLQSDGRILVGGNTLTPKNNPKGWLARLLPNGQADATFDARLAIDGQVIALAVQPDGKIVVGGRFKNIGGISRNHLARLNADGAIDPSYASDLGADNSVFTLVSDQHNRLLVGGSFTGLSGVACGRLARLNNDGSIDRSFNPASGANSSVRWLVTQPDGKILVIGEFTLFNSQSHSRIVRLLADQPKANADNSIPPARSDEGWIDLFNDKNLSGWTALRGDFKDVWKINVERVISCKSTKTHLFSPSVYTNFEFRTDIKLEPGADGGIIFHSEKSVRPVIGYEVDAVSAQVADQTTGSLVGFAKAARLSLRENEWFTLRIVAVSNHFVTLVNNQIAVNYFDTTNTYSSGRFALQQLGDGKMVMYRRPQVKPLPADEKQAWAEVKRDLPLLPER